VRYKPKSPDKTWGFDRESKPHFFFLAENGDIKMSDQLLREIRQSLTEGADRADEIYRHIASGHPADDEGFPKPTDPDLADALKVISELSGRLSRVVFKISQSIG
jgi:hypothetical protein